MKKIQFILLGLLLSGVVQAQENLTINDINFRQASYNTGFTIDYNSLLDATFTSSVGKGEQNTGRFHFMSYGNFHKLHTMFGGKINSKSYGLYKNTTAELLLGKGLKLSSSHQLNVGLSFGMHFTSINNSELNEFVNMEDPVVEDGAAQYRFIIGYGLAYTFKEHTKVGFSSMPSIVKSTGGYYPMYIFNTSHQFLISDSYSLEPEVLLYGSNVSRLSMETNIKAGYDNKAWVKLGVRTTQTLVVGAIFQYEYINVGYMYNYNWGSYNYINPGVHNINLGVHMPTKTRRRPNVRK